ncbi:MAG: dipeptidase [Fimbriimonadaceae bacterium]
MISSLALLAVLAQTQQDPYLAQARALHAKYPLIDGHNDLPGVVRRRSDGDFVKLDLRKTVEGAQTDVARIRAGGLGGQFWSVYVPTSLSGPEAVKQTLNQIELVHRMIETYPDVFQAAYTADDVERAFKAGKVASMFGMEGGHSIDGSLETLRAMYRAGARYMTLTHNRNTPWADSCTDTPAHGGLSPFGEQVVLEMNRLGMLVDLSHVSPDTMRDALRVSRAPVIYSHSGAHGVCNHPRNVPDDVLPLVKQNNGVVMVVVLDSFTSQAVYDHDRARTAAQDEARRAFGTDTARVEQAMREWDASHKAPVATLSQVADHIDHIMRRIGIDHVGIGADFDGGGGVQGLEDVSKYPMLTAELLRRGYTEDDVAKILGLNVLRVMRAAERTSWIMKREALDSGP